MLVTFPWLGDGSSRCVRCSTDRSVCPSQQNPVCLQRPLSVRLEQPGFQACAKNLHNLSYNMSLPVVVVKMVHVLCGFACAWLSVVWCCWWLLLAAAAAAAVVGRKAGKACLQKWLFCGVASALEGAQQARCCSRWQQQQQQQALTSPVPRAACADTGGVTACICRKRFQFMTTPVHNRQASRACGLPVLLARCWLWVLYTV